jgi:LysM repeat protein
MIKVRNSITVLEKKVLDAYFAEKIEDIIFETVKGKETTHKVKSGDNLSTIASKNGIKLAKLKKR